MARINALATYWHGNTVRIQVAPAVLDANTPGFLFALLQEVSTAEAAGLNVIISAQYEKTGYIKGPDASTVAFWKTIAPIYAADQRVWFDLINEPSQNTWDVWRNGSSNYVGMQTLVDDIRAVAPNNLIVAEGIQGAKTLNGVTGYLLAGGNIVYAVHPYFYVGYDTPAAWDANWGNLAAQIPVLLGEWGVYESTKPECQLTAPTLVPQFMTYVSAHHVGLISWALLSGNLIRQGNLTNPTAFDAGATWQCAAADYGSTAQGIGQVLRALFMS